MANNAGNAGQALVGQVGCLGVTMIIREGQRKVIMPDRIGGRERDRDILCAGEETETAMAWRGSATEKDGESS